MDLGMIYYFWILRESISVFILGLVSKQQSWLIEVRVVVILRSDIGDWDSWYRWFMILGSEFDTSDQIRILFLVCEQLKGDM